MFYKSIDGESAGVWRKQPIIVTGSEYRFPKPDELEAMMKDLIDGNGRVGRLIMNLSLIQDGYMLAIVPPICRMDYLNTIRQYQDKGITKTFAEFIAEELLKPKKK